MLDSPWLLGYNHFQAYIRKDWSQPMFAFGVSAPGIKTEVKPEVIAHRGASYKAPENTLAAINLAWKVRADAVEIDIHLTKDDAIVAMHDFTAARTTGVDMKICDSKLKELRSLDAGKWKDEQWTGEKIPLFQEVLATIPEGKRLFVEIKCGPQIVPEFLKVLDASGKADGQVAVISFNSEVIRTVKCERPGLQAYWLCSPKPGNTEELFNTARSVDADGVDAQATDSLDEEFVRKFREANMQVYVWTVDDDETAKRMAALGIDGITTNKPEEIRLLLKPQEE